MKGTAKYSEKCAYSNTVGPKVKILRCSYFCRVSEMPTECKFTALPFLRKKFEDIKYIFLPYLIDFTSIYNTNYKNTFSKERFTDLNSFKNTIQC